MTGVLRVNPPQVEGPTLVEPNMGSSGMEKSISDAKEKAGPILSSPSHSPKGSIPSHSSIGSRFGMAEDGVDFPLGRLINPRTVFLSRVWMSMSMLVRPIVEINLSSPSETAAE